MVYNLRHNLLIPREHLSTRIVNGKKTIHRMEGTNRFRSVPAIECLALSGEGGSSVHNNGVINQVWVARAECRRRRTPGGARRLAVRSSRRNKISKGAAQLCGGLQSLFFSLFINVDRRVGHCNLNASVCAGLFIKISLFYVWDLGWML